MFIIKPYILQTMQQRIQFSVSHVLFRSFSSKLGSHLDNGTIFALSSGLQKSGVGLIRVSGNDSKLVISKMTKKSIDSILPRYSYYTNLYHPKTNKLLDKSILVYYQSPKSYTGEDIIEIQCHGSIAVITSILSSLSLLPNFRAARAGEFTRRGFLNNKYDLTEVEALSDLLQSETEKQREQALLGYTGVLSDLCKTWKTILVNSLSYMETLIDFSDNTDDLDETIYNQKGKDLQVLLKDMQKYTNNYDKSQMIRNGLVIPIFGLPNAGKSSLLNKLVHSERAIVSPYKGTTRDIIEVNANLNGFKIIFQDTAGIHETTNEIEQIGIHKSIETIKTSTLRIYIMDINEYLKNPQIYMNLKPFIDKHTILIMNKMDLLESTLNIETLKQSLMKELSCKDVIFTSCKLDNEISKVEHKLSQHIEDYYKTDSTNTNEKDTMNEYLLNTRQQSDLNECEEHIKTCLSIYNNNMVDAVAEELRLALGCIGRITGQIDIEHVLDTIFSTFCIGK